MNIEVDVLIVGGGPAGLAAGIVCARRGLRTMICEKQTLPADKPCGEGVMPTGLAHLERLGVKKYLAAREHFPIDGICYHSPKGKSAQANFREGPGWGIPRLELSAALLHRAQELDCLEIRSGVRAIPIDLDAERQNGSISVQVENDRVKARLLIGADGLNSSIRQWAGLQASRGVYQRWGARQHFHVAPWSQYVEVYWQDGLEAYVTPCGENLVGVAFLWDRRRHPRLPGGSRLIPTLLEAFPTLATRLQPATALDQPLAIGPLQRNVIRAIGDGVLLIGDAAGYLDALTGEGISLALAQAIALEETVVPVLLEPGQQKCLSQKDLHSYEEAHKIISRPYYQVTKLALWLSRRPHFAEQTISLLGRNPALFQSLLSANMGLLPLWQVPFWGKMKNKGIKI